MGQNYICMYVKVDTGIFTHPQPRAVECLQEHQTWASI
jgi:hypothetical protein